MKLEIKEEPMMEKTEDPPVGTHNMKLCECIHLTRLYEETQRGKYPASEHAPSCEHYQQERFIEITYPTGERCVTEKLDDEDIAESSHEIWLTRDQFERLSDFAGP